MAENFFISSGKVLAQVVGEILYFPIWWYSVGFFRHLKAVFNFWRNQEKALGFSIWLKNLFVPMYGQYDWLGRLISFCVRLVQIIFRGAILLLLALVLAAWLVAWLLLPVFMVLALLWQFLS